MPPRVVRQWQASRTPLLANGISRRLQIPPRVSALSTFRCLHSQALKYDDRTIKSSAPNSAIVIPRSVVNTQPEDLVAHIQPAERSRLTRDHFAVFFVTPSFSSWLLDDGVFLSKALRRAYAHVLDRDDQLPVRVHALCAAVDKLPTPEPVSIVDTLKAQASARMRGPPVRETGFEGMAYATLCFSDSIPSQPSVPDETAAISFVAPTAPDAPGAFVDILRLPLANTVFQTGSPTTMAYSIWEKGSGMRELTLKSKQDVTHHTIRMQDKGGTRHYTSTFAVPLVPLTVPRCVEASMGNILRRVTGPDGESVTASQELEHVVPRYFSTRGEPQQATTVWALIIPKHTMDSVSQKTNSLVKGSWDKAGLGLPVNEDDQWESLWKREPPLWNDLVPTALSAGARLHRVLSGGGGWGKKAGLLSLDPITTTEDSSPTIPGIVDGPEDLSSALRPVARDGDYIQFFIFPSSKLDVPGPLEMEFKRLQEVSDSERLWGWEFGTIPSTVDSPPTNSGQHDGSPSNDVFVFRHTFGALTEGGMTITRRHTPKTRDSPPLPHGSKIDVPFSRFSAVNILGSHEEPQQDSLHGHLNIRAVYPPIRTKLERRSSFQIRYTKTSISKDKSLAIELAKTQLAVQQLRKEYHLLAKAIRKREGQQTGGPREKKTPSRDGHRIGSPRIRPVSPKLVPLRKLPIKEESYIPHKFRKITKRHGKIAHRASKIVYKVGRLTDDYRLLLNAIRKRWGPPAGSRAPKHWLSNLVRPYIFRRNEVSYSADGLRQIQNAVQCLTEDYRVLANSFKRRSGKQMDLAIKEEWLKKYRGHHYVRSVEMDASWCASRTYLLRRKLDNILERRGLKRAPKNILIRPTVRNGKLDFLTEVSRPPRPTIRKRLAQVSISKHPARLLRLRKYRIEAPSSVTSPQTPVEQTSSTGVLARANNESTSLLPYRRVTTCRSRRRITKYDLKETPRESMGNRAREKARLLSTVHDWLGG